MKKFIIAILCFVVWGVLLCMLYTYDKSIYNMLLNTLGAYYCGTLIGKLVDWLCDKKTK